MINDGNQYGLTVPMQAEDSPYRGNEVQNLLAEWMAKENYKFEKQEKLAEMRERYRFQGYCARQAQKEAFREKREEDKKAVSDQVHLSETGRVLIRSENLRYIRPQDRILSNLLYPELITYGRLCAPAEKVFFIRCYINSEEKRIFLDARKIGNGNYLLRKLAEAGAKVYAATAAQETTYAKKLLNLLIGLSSTSICLPEQPGWAELPSGEIFFWSEDNENWNTVKEKTR